MHYDPHDAFVAPARAGAQIWRLVAGLLTVAAIVIGLGIALDTVFVSSGALADRPGRPITVLVSLFAFGFLSIGAMVAARLLHHRPGLSLIGPPARALRDGLRVLAALAILQIVLGLLPPWGDGGTGISPRENLPFGDWLSILPLSLLAVLVQTGSEEVLFRGYLQQQLAARFSARWVWLVLPSLAFGLLHYDPASMGGNAWLIVAWASLFGLAAADLTARTGSLGAAIGFHAFNNFFAILVVSATGPLDGLALFSMQVDMADPALRPMIALDIAALFVSWLAARLALRV
ncbi:CPBP family intramembrane glutamic endopeptidase [Poseidonocella sedimentorum]|uniref:CAAX prenyl protease 2/Lysostaphin resistance protein A-like domain-containing protein n=1 Tax=Poseidonocella sedimentorum TaxID=871652 RepID=A0A1I6D5Y7_9RHOB|nr:CPBP family intramembrane glutamic endopeptidase [Poseidonocella sedimentorum]SFR00884.1 hypothetical protein SAMN04515673_102241 [Poseidonocella sedimentorum]